MEISSNKAFESFLNNEFHKFRTSGTLNVNVSKFFGKVGSTTLEDIPYENQLEIKLTACKELFQEVVDEEILKQLSIVKSPEIYEYRFKTEFVCSYNPKFEPHNRFGQRKKNIFNWIVDIDEFPLVKKEWFDKTRSIYEFLMENNIRCYDVVKHDGELRYLVLKEYKDQAMLSIVTKSAENEGVISQAAQKALDLGFSSVYWVKQDSLGDRSFGETIKFFGDEFIKVNFETPNHKEFLVGPNSFFQNNINSFQNILEYIIENFRNLEFKNLIDLYCGVGTIGVALSELTSKVIGIDNNEENIKLAHLNLELNKLEHKANYQFGDASELNLEGFKFEQKNSLLIVDPPRTGLDQKTIDLILKIKPEHLVYISCNPVTQKNDFEKLLTDYKLGNLRIFDLFPHTNHMESVAIMRKL